MDDSFIIPTVKSWGFKKLTSYPGLHGWLGFGPSWHHVSITGEVSMLPVYRLNPRNACQQQGCQSPRQCWGSQVETFRQRGRQPSPASLLSRWLQSGPTSQECGETPWKAQNHA